jgi:hypothetical protein
MGLLNTLFGGGTKLQLKLDASEVPAGGQLSGQVTVQGGKKPLKISSVFVRLLHVTVHSKPDQTVPEVKVQLLVDSVIATNDELPPGVEKKYSFRFPVPTGLEPTAHSVSYTVLAQADIPGVADPKEDVKLKIVASRGGGLLSLDDIKARYPGLDSPDEDTLEDALQSLDCDCYSDREQLVAAEAFLVELVRRYATNDVGRAALSAWSNLVDGRVRKEHLAFLQELLTMSTERRFFDEVIEAAARFAEEGALPVVQGLARHAEPRIREEMANQLRFNAADRFAGKRELLESLLVDSEPAVRAAAIGALSEWREDTALIRRIAGLIDSDPATEVKVAGISCLALVHNYGSGTLGLDVYERHVNSPEDAVREAIAESLHWLPETEVVRIGKLVQRLLLDSSGEIRRVMAFQFHNLSDMRQLAPMALEVLHKDESETVRAAALGGVGAMLEPDAAIDLAEKHLAGSPSDHILWSVVDVLRHHNETPRAQALLYKLANSNLPVASAARDAIPA